MNLVENASAYLELFLAFSGVVAALAAFVRWGQKGLEKKILAEIEQATHQIQPHANGGKSLSDLHHKLDRFMDYQMAVNEKREKDIYLLKTAVVDLENETEGIA